MNEELIEQLVVMTDQALNEYTNSYLYRAQEDRKYFFNDKPSARTFNEHTQFGKIWEDKDYAFRVLLNPEQQALAISAIKDTPDLQVSDENIELLKKVLEQLAEEQPADVVMDADDSGFWDEFTGRFRYFLLTGEVILDEEEEYEE